MRRKKPNDELCLINSRPGSTVQSDEWFYSFSGKSTTFQTNRPWKNWGTWDQGLDSRRRYKSPYCKQYGMLMVNASHCIISARHRRKRHAVTHISLSFFFCTGILHAIRKYQTTPMRLLDALFVYFITLIDSAVLIMANTRKNNNEKLWKSDCDTDP